jgi:hypothetical protein
VDVEVCVTVLEISVCSSSVLEKASVSGGNAFSKKRDWDGELTLCLFWLYQQCRSPAVRRSRNPVV